jgi:hypothetical protein
MNGNVGPLASVGLDNFAACLVTNSSEGLHLRASLYSLSLDDLRSNTFLQYVMPAQSAPLITLEYQTLSEKESNEAGYNAVARVWMNTFTVNVCQDFLLEFLVYLQTVQAILTPLPSSSSSTSAPPSSPASSATTQKKNTF